jgi:small-conductance mechanosensitive channel
VSGAVDLLDRLDLPGWAAALVALCLSLLLAILARRVLELVARRLTGNKSARAADVLVDALRGPVTTLLFLVGVEISLGLADLPGRLGPILLKTVSVSTIFVAAYGVGRGILGLLREFSPLSTRLAPISGFLAGLVRAIVGLLAVLVALDSVGISITPILASLGVGSVAVALALQETLGNFFAGIAILADHPVRVGELVRIEPDLEGRVHGIGWRTTSLIDLQNNLVVIPNATLARAVVRNYSRPEPGETTPVRVIVEHGTAVPKALAAMNRALQPMGAKALVTGLDPAGIELTAGVPVPSRTERASVRARALESVAAAFTEDGVLLASSAAAPPKAAR